MINFVRFKVIDGWEMGDAVSNVYNENDVGVKFGTADWFTAPTVGQEGDWVKDQLAHIGHTWSEVTIDETLKKQIRRINGIPVIMLCFPNPIKTIDNEHDTLKKIIDAFEPFPNVKFLFTNTWDLCSSTLHSFNIVDYILDRFKNIEGERINFILCNKHIVDEIKFVSFVNFVEVNEFFCKRGSAIIFDLCLSQSFSPKNNDGEVSEFTSLNLNEVSDLTNLPDKFKFDSRLVAIDFLLRKGFFKINNEKDFDKLSILRQNIDDLGN